MLSKERNIIVKYRRKFILILRILMMIKLKGCNFELFKFLASSFDFWIEVSSIWHQIWCLKDETSIQYLKVFYLYRLYLSVTGSKFHLLDIKFGVRSMKLRSKNRKKMQGILYIRGILLENQSKNISSNLNYLFKLC